MSSDSKKTSTQILCFDSSMLLFFALFCFCLLSIFNSGYHIFRYNQSLQIPLVYYLNNPELYPNDPFAATLPYYASILWKIIAVISNSVSLQITLFTLFVVEKLLLIYAAARLAHVFAPQSCLATLSSMALLAIGITPIVGSGTVVADYMEHTAFSIPFFMLAAAAFHQLKHYQWAIWMALGALSNVMYAAYALTYFGLIFLLDADYRRLWKQWFSAFAIFLVLNLPTYFLALSAIKRESADNQLWFQVVEKRFPHHLFPLEWPLTAYLKLTFFALLVIIIAAWQRKVFPRLSKHLMLWSAAAAIWIFLAYVAAYLLKIPTLLVLHPGRATDIWYLFASIGLIAIFASLVDTQKGMFGKAVFLCALMTLMIFWQPRPTISLFLILSVLTAVTLLTRNMMASAKMKAFAMSMILTTALLVSFYNFALRADEKGGVVEALLVTPSSEQIELALWAEENTSIDSVFFVPPNWSNFRTLSKRPVFVTIKDASAILWDRVYVRQWVERVQALGLDITRETPGLSGIKKKSAALFVAFTDEQIRELKQRYPVDYWIVAEEKETDFPIIFRTTKYKVVRL